MAGSWAVLYLLIVSWSALASVGAGVNCTAADKNFWETGGGFFQATDKLQLCGSTTAGDEAQIEACISIQFADYSERCQDCFEGTITCTIQACFDKCVLSISGLRQEGCVQCVEQFCNPPFATCAGFFLESCPGCVDPNAPSDILPAVGGALAGVAVAAIMAYLIVQYKKRPKGDAAVEMTLDKLGIPQAKRIVPYPGTTRSNPIESQDFDNDQDTELMTHDGDGRTEMIPFDGESTVALSHYTKGPTF